MAVVHCVRMLRYRALSFALASAILVAALSTTAGAMTGATVASVAASAKPPTSPSPPVLDWVDCGDGFECATAEVPLDHRHPRGRMIDLAVIRKPASDRANRIGSVFLNPGGPGGSGVEFVRTAPPPAFAAFSRFDVVGFDPRGVGASEPSVDCGPPGDPEPLHFQRPSTIDARRVVRESRRYGRRCLANSGQILAHISTANVARDLDLLRAAVGDPKLNYLGISYGSVIGATYASMFPGRTRAMVLDSPLDVQEYYDHPVRHGRAQSAGFETMLGRFFTACAAAGPACSFGGDDPWAAFDALVERLDREPLSHPSFPIPVNGDVVRLAALSTMFSTFFWPAFSDALAAADSGVPLPLIEYLGANSSGIGNDAFGAVRSVDQRWPHRASRFLADGEHRFDLFEHFWWINGYERMPFGLWPVEDHGAFRGEIDNPSWAAPILVVAVRYDPTTPYAGARNLVDDLGNARLLTYESDGHGALTSFDPCLLGHAFAYLNGGVLPSEGATCVDPTEPFPASAPSAPAQAAEPWLIEAASTS